MGFCFKSLSCSYQVLTTDNLALILALEQERESSKALKFDYEDSTKSSKKFKNQERKEEK